MRTRSAAIRPTPLIAASAVFLFCAGTCSADVIYNNDTPNNLIATASRPDTPGAFEIESADDFVLTRTTSITNATFTGLIVPGVGGVPSIGEIVIELYRVFPKDSDAARTPNVPTRTNSPSDVAF